MASVVSLPVVSCFARARTVVLHRSYRRTNERIDSASVGIKRGWSNEISTAYGVEFTGVVVLGVVDIEVI